MLKSAFLLINSTPDCESFSHALELIFFFSCSAKEVNRFSRSVSSAVRGFCEYVHSRVLDVAILGWKVGSALPSLFAMLKLKARLVQ